MDPEYLSYIDQESLVPIFRCYIRRVAAVLSKVDFTAFHLPIPSMPQSSAVKFFNASLILHALYNNVSRKTHERNFFLELIAEEGTFIYLVVHLSCQAIKLQDGKFIE